MDTERTRKDSLVLFYCKDQHVYIPGRLADVFKKDLKKLFLNS